MKNNFISKKPLVMLLFAAMLLPAGTPAKAQTAKKASSPTQFVHRVGGNPYLPLWEHLPDGEPRVFEDPDNPGKYRVYIIGSHDVRFGSYCGPDIRAWSAPQEDLTNWRDEGPIFTYPIEGQWDVMYAPDLVEIKRKDGKKEYYLYPHSRGRNREAMVCKGDRPTGPFKPINMNEDGTKTVPGSIFGFDPSVYVETLLFMLKTSPILTILIIKLVSELMVSGDSNVHQLPNSTRALCILFVRVLKSFLISFRPV